MRVLVVGATSFWGRSLVDSLRAAGGKVTVFSRDPRAFPSDWRMGLQCHWGELQHDHILDEAVRDVDRVVACIGAGRYKEQADKAEVDGIRHLLAALGRHPGPRLIRLSSPSPLREADWWPMASRRRADLLVESSSIPHCVVRMGWAPEMLSPLLRGNRLWLPGPRSTPGAILWQSKRRGVEALTDLVLNGAADEPTRIQGSDKATVAELSTRICVRHPGVSRVQLPGTLFRWMAGMGSDFAFAGLRLVHSTSKPQRVRDPKEPEDSLAHWPLLPGDTRWNAFYPNSPPQP